MKEGLMKLELQKKMWFSVLLNLFLFLIVSWLMPIRYETIDDTTLLLFSSGAYTGTPDAHLVYINYIYGSLLTFLYNNITGIEWYTVCFAIVHVVSLSIISWKIFNADIRVIWKVIAMFLLYVLEMQIVLNFQYTTTAALCATAAIVLYLRENKWQQYCAALLFFLAALIRLDPAFLAFLVCSPAILYYLLEQKNKKTVLVSLALFVFLPILGVVIDHKIYDSDPDWKEYKEFNYYRGKISDNPTAIKLKNYPTFIDSTDYLLFRNFFPDISVIDNETAKNIYEYVDDISFSKKLQNIYTREKYPLNLRKYELSLAFFCLITIFLAVYLEDKRKKALIISTTLLLLLLLSYTCLEGMLKHRVFFSALIPYSLVLVSMCASLKRKNAIRCGAVLLVAIIVFLGGDLYNKRKNKNRFNKNNAPKTTEILKQSKLHLKKDEIVVAYLNSIVIESLSPYSISDFFKENRHAIINWTSKIPFNKGYMESFLDIIDKNLVTATSEDLKYRLPIIQQNIWVNYGLETEIEIVAVFEDLHLIRLKEVKKDSLEDGK